jgi:hypothetical protein
VLAWRNEQELLSDEQELPHCALIVSQVQRRRDYTVVAAPGLGSTRSESTTVEQSAPGAVGPSEDATEGVAFPEWLVSEVKHGLTLVAVCRRPR